ncbi:MAG: DUF456 domain-containing protein [Patescibacteria group bacterium]|nr:DUF456 domain-containing protein [Patescibacteria group bacterium]
MEIFLTILIIILIVALIVTGLIGTIVPMLPGAPLIIAGMIIYAIWDKFQHMSVWTFVVLLILTIFLAVIDYVSHYIGAKAYKASKTALICSAIGGIIGLFTGNVVGFIFGPLIGAVIGELIDSQDLRKSLKTGTGVFVGFLSGTLVKFVIAMIIVVIFIGSVIF